MQQVRRPLEIESVRIATRSATPEQRRIINARAAELMAVFEAGEDWRPADHRFHNAVHDATGNPLFRQFIEQIQKAFHDIYETPFGKPHLARTPSRCTARLPTRSSPVTRTRQRN